MQISGKTKVMGIIGNPIGHSMSPVIHNTLAKLLDENMIYVPFLVENVEQAVKGAYEMNIQGMNVTVPHKSAVMPFLTEVDEEAKIIGAVNTLVRTPEGFKGYNTDMPGLFRALLSEGIRIEGNPVMVIGAGGAARAAAFLCAWKKAEKIVILNRTKEKAEVVVAEIIEKTGYTNIEAMGISDWKSVSGSGYIVLQATKAGLYPDVEKTPIEEPAFFEKVSVVYDLIYTPSETKFMKLARQQGVKAYHGLKMLLYQAILGYEYWNGVAVPEAVIEQTYEVLKKECNINE